MSTETESGCPCSGGPCPRCGYTIFPPEDASVTCSECGLVIEPGFSGRNLLRYADPEWLVHLQRGLRVSRVLSRFMIVIVVLIIAVIGLGFALIPMGTDGPLEALLGKLMLFTGFGLVLTVIGMPLTVWWMTQPEAVLGAKDDHAVLRVLSLLFLPLVGTALGFASPRAGFNLPGMTIMVLSLGTVGVLWYHAMLMRRHIHALLMRCPPFREPFREHAFLRGAIPVLAILYILGPFRWSTTGFWTPPKDTSDLLIGLAALAWFRVYFDYGKFCLKAVSREIKTRPPKLSGPPKLP